MTPAPVERKGKLIILGETQVPTGYSRIVDALLPSFAQTFDVSQIALRLHRGAALPPWRLIVLDRSSHGSEENDLLGEILSVKPDLLLMVGDFGYVRRHVRLFDAIEHNTRVVAYGPVDGPAFDPLVADALRHVHHVVTFTTRQADFLQRLFGLRAAGTKSTPHISAVGLGVDTSVFRPHESRWQQSGNGFLDRSSVRRLIFGTDAYDDSFIVLNANRNVIRKRIDLTVGAFAKFAKGRRRNAFLYLHMADGGRSAWNLRRLTRTHDVEDRAILPPRNEYGTMLSSSQLALIYNACDVGINTSVGEGWGLVSLEHAATGAAQIVPDHSSSTEVWGDKALRGRSYRSLVTDVPFYEEFTVDPDDMADLLEALYDDRTLLLQESLGALRRASEPAFSWRHVADCLRSILLGELERGQL